MAEIPISLRRRRMPRRAGRVPAVAGRISLTVLPLFVGWSVSGTIPAPAPSSNRCEVRVEATTREYLTGFACPPAGFAGRAGYEPQLVLTGSGWRFVRTVAAGAECSGPLADAGASWDFTAACGTHDYGFDLVRFGVADRTDVDALLYEDMLRSCRGRGPVGTESCKAMAEWAHAALAIGDLAEMEPKLGDFDGPLTPGRDPAPAGSRPASARSGSGAGAS
jgi:hypothetical protein